MKSTMTLYNVTKAMELDEEAEKLVKLGKFEGQCTVCFGVNLDTIEARDGTPICKDRFECKNRLLAVLSQDEVLKKLIEDGHEPYRLVDSGKQPKTRKEATNMAKATATSKRKVKTKRDNTPKLPGICEFSGEEIGSGSKFKPGADAKLKSALGNLGAAGDVPAVMELVVRGWPIKKAVEAATVKAAKTKVKALKDADAWLTARVNERLTKLKRGTDPIKALGGTVRSRKAA